MNRPFKQSKADATFQLFLPWWKNSCATFPTLQNAIY